MGKSSPPPPDYQALAQQQGIENEKTARLMAGINRPNEYTPYGSREWTQDPKNPDAWTSTQKLSEAEQAKLDKTNELQYGMLEAAQQYGLPSVLKAMGTNITPVRDAQIGWEAAYAPDQRMQTESGIHELPWLQEGLDYSGAPAMPTPDTEMRSRVENSLYDSADRWLTPQYDKQQNRLDTKLSNQGIFAGSEAFTDSQDVLAEERDKAFAEARDRAIIGGGNEMSNQFNMGMNARQQGVNEITGQGQFANAARGQGVGELLSDMQARNAAIAGQGNVATAQQGASNTGTQAWLAQKAQAATLPINVMNAVQTGSQVNNPQWQPFNNNIQVEAAPIFQAGVAGGNAANAAASSKNAATGQMAGAAAAVGAAALMF